LRAWLQESENEPYTTADERDTWIEKCGSELDWLDMDSFDAKKSEFNSRGKALEKPFLNFKNRKAEHKAR
jgi:hypothetical protein